MGHERLRTTTRSSRFIAGVFTSNTMIVIFDPLDFKASDTIRSFIM